MRERDISAGAPCWIDLNTSDTDVARAFYTGVFGWTAGEASEEFGGYFMFDHKGAPVAGCMPAIPDGPADIWSVYLTVSDAGKTLEAAVASGGQVAVPAMTVGDTGTMGMVLDPGGSAIGLWQPGQFTGIANTEDAGLPSWFELHSSDYAGALAFYRDVFGWTIDTMMDTPEMKYSVLDRGSEQLAGIFDASGEGPDARFGWSFYIWVDDTDATAAKVTELGGSVLDQPMDTPYGRLATVADPHDAVFKLMARNDQMPG
jgi:uncharacterized protein